MVLCPGGASMCYDISCEHSACVHNRALKLLEGSDLFQRFTSFCACRQQQPSLYCVFFFLFKCKIHIWCFNIDHSSLWQLILKCMKETQKNSKHFHEVKGKECHNAGELAVDRLAIVFTPLQENQFWSWRTWAGDRNSRGKGNKLFRKAKDQIKIIWRWA